MSDEPGLDLDAGLWLSISEIARQKDISRQAVAKRVDQLVALGKLQTKPGDNGTKLVNLAQYDRAIGETGDAFKEAGAETKAEAETETPASPALRDHQARAARYTADLRFLDLEERLGRLVPVADVVNGAQLAAEAIIRAIDRLPSFAESMAGAVTKDGVAGARSFYKENAREVRQAIAEAMGVLAGAAEPMKIEPADDAQAE